MRAQEEKLGEVEIGAEEEEEAETEQGRWLTRD
jgi:hypothetical protein